MTLLTAGALLLAIVFLTYVVGAITHEIGLKQGIREGRALEQTDRALTAADRITAQTEVAA